MKFLKLRGSSSHHNMPPFDFIAMTLSFKLANNWNRCHCAKKKLNLKLKLKVLNSVFFSVFFNILWYFLQYLHYCIIHTVNSVFHSHFSFKCWLEKTSWWVFKYFQFICQSSLFLHYYNFKVYSEVTFKYHLLRWINLSHFYLFIPSMYHQHIKLIFRFYQ